jgi:RHS repeat-associated protein
MITANWKSGTSTNAFGKPYAGDLTQGMNLGYTGKPYDAVTGMYNYGYRDYQPEMARFTTVEPIRDEGNWFAYVNNDPVNWVDLWGLETNPVVVHAGTRYTSSFTAKGEVVTIYTILEMILD